MIAKRQPRHARFVDGTQLTQMPNFGDIDAEVIDHSTEIPHVLSDKLNEIVQRRMSLIVRCGDELEAGDRVNIPGEGTVIVKEIEERRPARGQWANNTYCNKPDFVQFLFKQES